MSSNISNVIRLHPRFSLVAFLSVGVYLIYQMTLDQSETPAALPIYFIGLCVFIVSGRQLVPRNFTPRVRRHSTSPHFKRFTCVTAA